MVCQSLVFHNLFSTTEAPSLWMLLDSDPGVAQFLTTDPSLKMASSHGLLIQSGIFLHYWLASWRNNCLTEPQTRFEAWEDCRPLLSSVLLIFIWLAFWRWFLFILSCQWAAWLRDQSASHLTHLSRLPCLPGGFLCPFMSFHSSFSLFLGIKSVFLILTHSFIGSHKGSL